MFKWLKILFVLLVGLPISWGSFHYINRSQLARNQKISQKASQQVEKKLNEELKKISLAISSLQVLFNIADTLDRPTFNEFTQPFLLNLPGIRALEWTPKLYGAQRAQHEQIIRAEGFKNYRIKVLEAPYKQVLAAPERPYYYPVQYIVPEKWNPIALGFDVLSNPVRVPSVERSEQTTATVVTPPLRLIQTQAQQRSFLVLQSIQKKGQTIGIIQGIYNMNHFVDTILKEQLGLLDLQIYDKTEGRLPFYQRAATDSLTTFSAERLKNWSTPFDITFYDRTWEVYTRPLPFLTAYPHRPIAYSALAIGLIITLVTIVVFVLNNRHARDLHQKVADSTQQLSEANHAQAILLKEIHHRVKNNLQVITGLLALQASSIEEEATRELFKVSQYRVSAMGMLHEQLYQTENLSQLSYGLYLEELVDQLLRSIQGNDHRIEVELQVPADLQLNLDTAIPLGLLINELVTNSLKYAFPNNEGSIYIHLQTTSKSGQYLLLMGDNGVGFSTAASTRKTTSLGLKLVRQLVRQLSGQLERLERGSGSHYRIYFNESEVS